METINSLKINYLPFRLGEPGHEVLAITAAGHSPQKEKLSLTPSPVWLILDCRWSHRTPAVPCDALGHSCTLLCKEKQQLLLPRTAWCWKSYRNPLSCNFVFSQSGILLKHCLVVYFVGLFIKDKHLVGKTGRQNTNLCLSPFIKNNEKQINALLGKVNVPAVKYDLILVLFVC